MDGTARVSGLPEVLLELTDTLSREFDTAGLLLHLAAVSVELLEVEAAGVLLLDEHRQLIQVAATHHGTHHLEQVQARLDRGPCLDAVRTDQPWSAWTSSGTAPMAGLQPAGPRRGIPVRARGADERGDVVGGHNLFRDATGPLTDIDRRTARLLATAAATGLLHRRAVHQLDTANEQLRQAWRAESSSIRPRASSPRATT